MEDSGREEASPVAGGQPSLTHCGELQDSLYIITGKFGELTEKLVRRHSSRQIFENVVHRDTGPANTRLARSPGRINDYVIQEVLHATLR